MRRGLKRSLLGWILALALALGSVGTLLPAVSVEAEETTTYTEGYYTYTVENGEATITKCDSSVTGVIEIPSTLGNAPVTSIGEKAFLECENITNIIIPDSVINIGDYAFERCKKITSITIPDSVNSIGIGIFYMCDSLQSFELSRNVTEISNSMFSGCTGLTHVQIPEWITRIGWSSFSGCTNLKSVDIPNSVTNVDHNAFAECSSLESITLPESLTNMGWNVFWGCTSLKEMTIPDSITVVPVGTFENCISISNVTLSNNCTRIERYAFFGCSSLESIKIPEGFFSFGESSFENCINLKSINFPNSLIGIEESAFSGCASLDNVTIPERVHIVHDKAFYGCTSLTTITVHKGTMFFDNVFTGCKNLTTINGEIRASCNHMFENCTLLREIKIADGTQSIGIEAFENCTSLTEIDIPDGVELIEESAFAHCENLKSIRFPNSVKAIEGAAFFGCKNLKSIVLPDDLESITGFSGCESLESVTFTNSVSTVMPYAFSDCTELKDIYYYGTESEWNTIDIETTENDYFLKATVHILGPKNKKQVTSIDVISPDSLSPGERESLSYTIFPEDATDKSVSWSSSDSLIVIVDFSGTITAIAEGTATITATAKDGSGVSGSCTVTVGDTNIPVKEIDVIPSERTMEKDETFPLTYAVRPADATNKTLSWYSSDESIATVNSVGVVTGKSAGTVTITAEATDGSGVSASCIVTVNETKVEKILGVPESTTLNMKESRQIIYTVSPENASNKEVSWSSSDENVVTVSESGYLTAVGAGEATVTVTAKDGSGVSASCRVQVNGMLKEIKLIQEEDLKKGRTIALTYTTIPQNVRIKNITWTSSDDSKATVDKNGMVKGIAFGEIKITAEAEAEDGSKAKAECDVTVEPKYDHPEDEWHFDNYNVNQISLPAGKLEEIKSKNSNVDYEALVTNLIRHEHNGECYGMALSSMLAYKGIFDPTMIHEGMGEETLNEVMEDDDAYKYIGLYHILQHSNPATARLNTCTSLPTDSKLRMIKALADSEETFILSYEGPIQNVMSRHAVLGYCGESGEWPYGGITYDYRVRIYDSNNPYLVAEEKEIEDSFLYIDTSDYKKWSIPFYELTQRNAKIVFIDSDISRLTSEDFSSFANHQLTNESGSPISLNVGNNSYQITQSYIFDEGGIEDDGIFCHYSADFSNRVEQLFIDINNDGTIEVAPLQVDDAFNVTLRNKDSFIAAKADTYDSFSYDENTRTVTVKKPIGNYNIQTTVNSNNTPWYKYEIESNGGDNVSIQLVNEGIIINSDNLQNMKVTGYNDAESKDLSFSTDKDKVLVTNDSDKLVVKTDSDDNGSYDQIIANENGAVVKVIGITISGAMADTLKVGDTAELTVTTEPADATDKSVAWSSSDPDVATVSADGKVTAVAPGTAIITATAADGSGITASVTITVVEKEPETIPVSSVTVSGVDEIQMGSSAQLRATISPDEATDKTVTWSISDEKIATVDEKGVVIPIAAGKVTITATAANGVKGSKDVTVTEKEEPGDVPATGIKVTAENTSLYVGGSTTLTVTITPSDATDKTVTWKSNDPSVATVDENGKVKAIGAGSTTITATAKNGVSDSVDIRVRKRSVTPSKPDKPVTPVTPNKPDTPVTPDTPTTTFDDVYTSDYYYDAVYWAVKKGITVGTGNNKFSPSDPCTRGQMAVFLWRLAGSPAVTGEMPFSDVKSSDYYYNAVLWAVKNHITSGTSTTTYSPNDPCTRGQMATFLWRYAKSPAVSTTESFTDIPSNAYYTESVAWAKANSIAAGVGDGKYAPEESCTRGQMVVFLQRLDGYLGE